VHREDGGARCPFRIAAALILILQIVAIVLASAEVRAAQLTLSWTDRSEGAAATRRERRSVDDSVFELVADVPAGVTEYVDAGLSPGLTYCYRAAAYDGTGVSDYSNEACATPTGEPLISVTVNKTGGGTGTVLSAPHGLVCGPNCSATYPASTVVRLIAVPAVGSTFVGWSGGPCFGNGACTVAGNSAVSVTASFSSLAASTNLRALPPPNAGR
jgi:hypothetical protein